MLGPDHQIDISRRIRQALGEHASVKIAGDDRLLGGMTVRHGDTLIDASVRRRIDDLARIARTVPVSDSWISA